jgi:hypothetical protein
MNNLRISLENGESSKTNHNIFLPKITKKKQKQKQN